MAVLAAITKSSTLRPAAPRIPGSGCVAASVNPGQMINVPLISSPGILGAPGS